MPLLATYIFAECDKCGAKVTLMNSHPGSYAPSITTLNQWTRDQGWAVNKARTYCPACKRHK